MELRSSELLTLFSCLMGFAKFSLGSDKLVGSWKLEIGLLMVILLVSLIVHSCLIVEYFTEFSEVAVFRKNGF